MGANPLEWVRRKVVRAVVSFMMGCLLQHYTRMEVETEEDVGGAMTVCLSGR
jgi:hypothetical protein